MMQPHAPRYTITITGSDSSRPNSRANMPSVSMNPGRAPMKFHKAAMTNNLVNRVRSRPLKRSVTGVGFRIMELHITCSRKSLSSEEAS